MSDVFSDDDFELPSYLLEREKKLIERNKQMEEKLQDLLKESFIPSQNVEPAKNEKEKEIIHFKEENPNIFEVEIHSDDELPTIQKIDPVPRLREALHLVLQEITSVRQQISETERDRTKYELSIVKISSELKSIKTDEERQNQTALELQNQITYTKTQINSLKGEIQKKTIFKS